MLSIEEVRKRVPYLRSCKKETSQPVPGDIQGQVPSWLRGTLLRIGSGLLEIGPDHFNHVFDGMALMHRFSIQDGQVEYLNKFLRSDTYQRNTAAGRIVVNEFGTNAAAPDPCRTLFEKVQSMFTMSDLTDNDLVNIVQYSDEFYACSETDSIWKIDIDTLESLKKVKLPEYIPVRIATAHPHEDKDGNIYNIGDAFGMSNGYTIVKFEPKKEPSEGAFDRGSVIARIPYANLLYPSYYHSFGMTENYIIFVEQPVFLSVMGMLFSSDTLDKSITCTEDKVRIHVVRRRDGTILPVRYIADSIFVFHHINAYEEADHLIMDVCCYDDGEALRDLEIKLLEKRFANPDEKFGSNFKARAKRFVLPLEKKIIKNGTKKNILDLPGSKARAYLEEDGVVHCTPELTSKSDLRTELPRINYGYNGVKYNYFYAIGAYAGDEETSLVKVNLSDGSVQEWSELGKCVSEPVFVADPDSSEEDGGVILSSLLDRHDDTKVSLLILDARTMKELARSTFVTESSVPADFHGIFVGDHQKP